MELNNESAVGEDINLEKDDDCKNSNSTHSLLTTNYDLPSSDLMMDTLKKSCGSLGPKLQNKTFSSEQTREIERRNGILMNKILAHNKRESRYGPTPVKQKLSSSALNRKRKDTEISRNNLVHNHSWLLLLILLLLDITAKNSNCKTIRNEPSKVINIYLLFIFISFIQ
ncbi:hypothetical protein RI129_007279 [Pyrocoelia pectoralis]|uniref:Cilia- and flagella-associated protein 97 n=1 Tax=Pyrocoelia pectoralis TaxID=417401 RepID=A0AAN7VC22_9COLE